MKYIINSIQTIGALGIVTLGAYNFLIEIYIPVITAVSVTVLVIYTCIKIYFALNKKK